MPDSGTNFIHIGFTGTRRGFNSAKADIIRKLLLSYSKKYKEVYFHHGDCVGADAQAHDIAESIDNISIIIHPPTKDKYRAYKRTKMQFRRPIGAYLKRDRDIVDECSVMIGVPLSKNYQIRSGTWYTMNYTAQQIKAGKKKELYIIDSDRPDWLESISV